MIELSTQISKNDSVTHAYEESTGKWWGCNWPTNFGPMKLQLEDVQGRLARLVAEATSGKESEAWHAIAKYLFQIEADAAAAEKLASQAIDFISCGKWLDAMASAEAAVALESKYRSSETWRPLRDAIAAELGQNPNLGSDACFGLKQ